MCKYVIFALALFQFACGETVDDKGTDEPCEDPCACENDCETTDDPPEPDEWVPTSSATIRVLVAFPADTWANAQSFGHDPEALALSRIELSNLIFSNSAVSHRAELADTVELVQSETDIAVLRDCDTLPFGPSCAAHWLAATLSDPSSELSTARTASEADVVMLMMHTSTDGYSGAATGYPSSIDAAQVAGATILYSDDIGFTHELGHVLGGSHDRYSLDGTVQTGIDFGYTVQSLESHTLMAYVDDCTASGGIECTRVPWLSNPEASLHGIALGDETTEWNACIAEHFGSQVGNYYEMISGQVPIAITDWITVCPYPMTNTFDVGGVQCVGDYTITNDADMSLVTGCGSVRGHLTVTSGVTSLAPLAELAVVEGSLTIDSPVLTSLAGLEALVSVDSRLTVESPVTSLSALSNLTRANFLNLSSDVLTDLSGLGALRIAETILISNSASLTSLAGLESLTTITDDLRIDNCDALVSLSGLEGLRHVGSLKIVENDSLVTLAALDGIETLQGLEVSDSTLLVGIDAFFSLTEISGRVTIKDLPGLANLAGLSSLDQAGTLDLSNLDLLTGLTGLESLRTVDVLVIQNNDGLLSLSALVGLETADTVTVFNNPNLSDCSLPNLTAGQTFSVANDPACVL